MNTKEEYCLEESNETDVLEMTGDMFTLIVWNDEINTFDWVIKALIDVCNHDKEQAEQCAMFIHTQGKYAVKHGDYDTLKPMCVAITDRGINATVEELAS